MVWIVEKSIVLLVDILNAGIHCIWSKILYHDMNSSELLGRVSNIQHT